MTAHLAKQRRWCVVVADDHGPESAQPGLSEGELSPIIYSGFGERTTLLQKVLIRAKSITPAEQVLVTAIDEYRTYWEPHLWFVRPQNRFVSRTRSATLLTSAAAVLSIVRDSGSNIVVVLPAHCFVANEGVLSAAIERVLACMSSIPEGAATLGMMDMEEGVDEDYLLASRVDRGEGAVIEARAHRPVSWVAKRLLQHDAMVASGIVVGYAAVLAAHIQRHWSALCVALSQRITAASEAGTENQFPPDFHRLIPRPVLRSSPWSPPTFPMRAYRVHGSGWRSLHSARAATKLAEGIRRIVHTPRGLMETEGAVNDIPNAWRSHGASVAAVPDLEDAIYAQLLGGVR